MIDLLWFYIDVSLWHLNCNYNLVLSAEHLFLSKWIEADFRFAVVGVSDHEKEIDVWVSNLKLTDPINGHLWNDGVHEHLDAGLVAGCHDLLGALLALLDTL